jgi:transposase InsO family protein
MNAGALAIGVCMSCFAARATLSITSACSAYMVVSDNGSELTSNAILAWADERHVDWHYIAPGQPM